MSAGSCLCGSLTWEFNGGVRESYHCHCSMCRKAHGAAFATFYLFPTRQNGTKYRTTYLSFDEDEDEDEDEDPE